MCENCVFRSNLVYCITASHSIPLVSSPSLLPPCLSLTLIGLRFDVTEIVSRLEFADAIFRQRETTAGNAGYQLSNLKQRTKISTVSIKNHGGRDLFTVYWRNKELRWAYMIEVTSLRYYFFFYLHGNCVKWKYKWNQITLFLFLARPS